MASDKKKMMVAFPIWTVEGIKELATLQGVPMTAVINMAVQEYLKANHIDIMRYRDEHDYVAKYGDLP